VKKPTPKYPIDATVQGRLNALEMLIDTEYKGKPAKFEEATTVKMAQVNQWFTGYRALRDKALRRLEEKANKPFGYFDSQAQAMQSTDDDVQIKQYDAGGSMGGGRLTLEDQPGLIKSWNVDREWVRMNVKHHTGVDNLCVVTGFGDSMMGMYNPGDPLLVDKGVTTCEFDGVYFFRVGHEGFIKRLQRIPGQGVLVISENPKYRDWTIQPDMDFQVFAKVLKVWQSQSL